MKKKQVIRERLAALREAMRGEAVDFALFTSSDFHASEYVGDYFKVSEYFSGCSSDNVILLVEAESARLWTDGRYFISAASELEGSGIELMRMGEAQVPTVRDYLSSAMAEGRVLGLDGRTVTALAGREYRQICDRTGAGFRSDFVPAEKIWTDRPCLPSHPVWILSEELAGLGFADKAAAVRERIRELGADWLVLSKLDDIMWLTNLRGADVDYNPVALSYLILGRDSADLFLQASELTEEVRAYAAGQKICLHEYEDIFSFLETRHFEGKVFLDPEASSDSMLKAVEKAAGGPDAIVRGENPTTRLKAVKNETELARSREVYLRDSVALCRFLYYMKKHIGGEEMTEVSAAEKLEGFRREQEGFLGLSFETISAYKANAAMAHYSPDPASCSLLQPEGLLLVDSGGQYTGGTTDVTRTMALGALTREMVEDFTTVAVANLRLLYAKFLYGCSGVNLDIYARAPFWERGINYNHGTGHGIGYILNVHEGPQNIRWKARGSADETVFEPGMFISDEPGMYVEGKYGIRTETILECVEDETTEYGRFLRFEPLTFAPIDLDALDTSLMDRSDICKLNDYHRRVWEKVSPFLEGAERDWLREATREVSDPD